MELSLITVDQRQEDAQLENELRDFDAQLTSALHMYAEAKATVAANAEAAKKFGAMKKALKKFLHEKFQDFVSWNAKIYGRNKNLLRQIRRVIDASAEKKNMIAYLSDQDIIVDQAASRLISLNNYQVSCDFDTWLEKKALELTPKEIGTAIKALSLVRDKLAENDSAINSIDAALQALAALKLQ